MTEEMPEDTSVFSAHAEVVPYWRNALMRNASILRARGGSSAMEHDILVNVWYSPRTRR